MSEFEEKICRYCFENEENGELISPCNCIGGQKWVHLDCLRRWQRMVIVNQPTHPAYYQDDVRHHKCNVCLSEYTCPPPTRGELMESFTGPEIAASLFPGRIMVSRDIFSDALERDVESFDPILRSMSGYDHWIRGVYLITSVIADEQEKVLTLNSRSLLEGFINILEDDNTVIFQGQQLKLMKEKSLSHVTSDDNLKEVLRSLPLPVTILLRVTTPVTCADDHITAVNIARSVSSPIVSSKFNPIYRAACLRVPSVEQVNVIHYIGGPVDESDITTCIVTGGPKGWTIIPNLKKALYLAASRNIKKYSDQGDIISGQKVILTNLISRPELNGRIGMALRYLPLPGPQRWEVQLTTGEGLKVKPINLISEGGSSRVMVFWGDARWSRAQLLGETARGHWGLCRATIGEFIIPPNEVWSGTLIPNRLAFAPISAMTDEILTHAVGEGGIQRQQMEAIYHTAAGARSITQTLEENNNDNDNDNEDIEQIENILNLENENNEN